MNNKNRVLEKYPVHKMKSELSCSDRLHRNYMHLQHGHLYCTLTKIDEGSEKIAYGGRNSAIQLNGIS